MNLDELRRLLQQHGLPSKNWVTKNETHLLAEIEAGECSLSLSDDEERRLTRTVQVVRIKCYFTEPETGDRLQLHEARQVFANGRERTRPFDYVAEKMQSNEEPLQAAVRGVKEELSLDIDASLLVPICTDTESKYSDTYDGLWCQYHTHTFAVEFTKSQFRGRYMEVQDDKTTYFEWKPVVEILQ